MFTVCESPSFQTLVINESQIKSLIASTGHILINESVYRHCNWNIRSSGMLRRADWELPTFPDNLSVQSSSVKHSKTEDLSFYCENSSWRFALS